MLMFRGIDIVDANPGRSSTAVACNSLFRGTLAAIASQISEPLINVIGQGWFFTGFSIILSVGCVLLVVISEKGKGWREAAERKEREGDGMKEREAIEAR